jgi:hypothetical protein
MSQLSPHRHAASLAAIVVAVALAVGGAYAPGSHAASKKATASLKTGTSSLAAPGAVDPGTYYVFRTRDTGKAATGEQNTRCNKYFGVRAALTITRLNALLFSFDSNPLTGRLTDQTKNLLGPGFICAVPGTNGNDTDAYAYSSLPGPGLVEANGPCGIAPVVVNNLPIILNCNLQVKPDPAKGITGGLITSNSLVNTINRTSSAPTGSVWTAHVVGSAANTGGSPGTIPPSIKPETPGLDFFVTRTRDETTSATSTECLRAGLSGKPVAVRTTNLAAAQPDPNSGHVPDTPGATVGKLTVCYAFADNAGYKAFAVADLKTATGTFAVRADGDCRTVSTVSGAGLRGQACSLTVASGPAKGGLITSNGLIEAGKPASAATSAIWTFALFGAPAAG